MKRLLIYRKTYPVPGFEAPGAEHFTWKEIAEDLWLEQPLSPDPKRQKQAEAFIAKAIEISVDYEIDTEIKCAEDVLMVNLTFEPAGAMGFLKRLVRYADDISFFLAQNGKKITMSLDLFLPNEAECDELY